MLRNNCHNNIVTYLNRLLCCIFMLGICAGYAEARGVAKRLVDTDTIRHSITYYDDRSGVELWHVTKIIEDRKGMIWFSSWNGLIRFDGYEFVSFKTKPGDGNAVMTDRVRNILPDTEVLKDSKDAKGNIFCRTDDKLFLFDVSTGLFSPVDEHIMPLVQKAMAADEKLYINKYDLQCNDTTIRDITVDLQDSYGNLWIKNSNGVYRISRHKTKWKNIPGLPHDVVRMMYKERNGKIWIASRDSRCLARLSSDLRLEGFLGRDGRLHKNIVDFAAVYSMLEDKNGQLWIGTKPDGLYRLKHRGDAEYMIEHVVPKTMPEMATGSIYDICEDKSGRIWLGSFVNALSVIENPAADVSSLRIANISKNNASYPASATNVRRMHITDDGMIIIVTTAGLVIAQNIYGADLDELKWRYHIREAQRSTSLATSATTDIVIMSDGTAAISTESGGVGLVKPGGLSAEHLELQNFTTDNGLISDIVQTLHVLDDKHILLQQNDHLTIIDSSGNEILTFLPAFWGSTLRFADARPIQINGDRLLLSLETGAITVPISELKKPKDTPKIVLTALYIAGQPANYCVSQTDTINLNANQRSLRLKYATLDYYNSKDIWYVTRIDEGQWSEPTANREISLYNLTAGEHKIEIRSTNAMGLWTQSVKTLTIVVEPQFLETWYGQFLLYLFLAAIIAALAYTYFYIRAIKKQRRETLEAYLMLVDESVKWKMDGVAAAEDRAQSMESGEQCAEEGKHNSMTVGQGEEPGTHSAENQERVEPAVEILMPRMTPEDKAFMQRLVNFVKENMGDSGIGVQDMAEAAAMSRSSLNRKMHTLLGVTPADFLREARMKRACELLRTTGRTTSDIAYACGFSDPKYFSKTFKASQGMSPKDFRAHHAEQ